LTTDGKHQDSRGLRGEFAGPADLALEARQGGIDVGIDLGPADAASLREGSATIASMAISASESARNVLISQTSTLSRREESIQNEPFDQGTPKANQRAGRWQPLRVAC
jgi:hypothetical protein